MLDTHHPHGFRVRRFAPTEPQKLDPRPYSGEKPESSSAITALRIFRPPLRATVTLRHGKPSHIVCKQIQGDVLWAAGPWRSSGDWWEQEGWSRDEWDIAVQAESHIALYRLVHDRLSGRWFLEGNFD